MKKTFLYISVLGLLGIVSCEKDASPGDNYDFSTSLPAYVALSSTAAKTVKQGTSTTVTFQMRTAMQQKATVYYDVTGGGVNLLNQTAVIDRDKTSIVATTLTLVKAVADDGTLLTIGSKNTPTTQKLTLNITL